MITLYVFPPSPRAFKVLAFVNYIGLNCQVRIIDLTKGEQNTPEYTALNPNQRMPTLEEDGYVVWESNAILQYLAAKKPEMGLFPTEPRARVDVTRWQFWDMAHWDSACAILIFERAVKQLLKIGQPEAAEIAKGEERFHRAAKVLDGQLAKGRYVTGNALTVADFSLGAPLTMTRTAQLPTEDYKNIRRWHAELS